MRGRHPAVLLLLPWPCASSVLLLARGAPGIAPRISQTRSRNQVAQHSSQGGRPQAAARCAVDIPPHGQRHGTLAQGPMPAHERQRGAAPGLPAAYQHSRRGWWHTSRARLQTASGSPAGLLGLAAGLLSLGGRRGARAGSPPADPFCRRGCASVPRAVGFAFGLWPEVLTASHGAQCGGGLYQQALRGGLCADRCE